MTAIHETAYRTLKPSYSKREVEKYFTPTEEELEFVKKVARKPIVKLAILVHIKVLNKIGRFVLLSEVPMSVIRYIMRFLPKLSYDSQRFLKQDSPANRNRLLNICRKHTDTTAFNDNGIEISETTAKDISKTRERIPDIINGVIEELIRNNYELPGFTTLTKIANQSRRLVNEEYFNEINQQLSLEIKLKFDSLLESGESADINTEWNRLKSEPGQPTNKVLSAYIDYFRWLRSWTNNLPDIGFIPVSKRRQFILEARALNAGNLKRVKQKKRYVLISVLFYSQLFSATNNLILLFIKKIGALHSSGQSRLRKFQMDKMKRAEKLIKQLRDVLNAYQSSDNDKKKIANITSSLIEDPEKLLNECEEHIAYADDNYFPFLITPYAQVRTLFFNCLSLLKLQSTTNDDSIISALNYVLENQKTRKEFYLIEDFEKRVGFANLYWMPKKWEKITVIKTGPGEYSVKRKYFELCLFSQITQELKSADLVVNESSDYSDFELQLVSMEEYEKGIDSFCEMLGISTDHNEYIESLKSKLNTISKLVDDNYHENKGFYLDEKGLHVRKAKKSADPPNLTKIEDLIGKKIKNRSVLDIITDVEVWTNLHQKFGPLSGFKGKIKDQRLRFILLYFVMVLILGLLKHLNQLRN